MGRVVIVKICSHRFRWHQQQFSGKRCHSENCICIGYKGRWRNRCSYVPNRTRLIIFFDDACRRFVVGRHALWAMSVGAMIAMSASRVNVSFSLARVLYSRIAFAFPMTDAHFCFAVRSLTQAPSRRELALIFQHLRPVNTRSSRLARLAGVNDSANGTFLAWPFWRFASRKRYSHILTWLEVRTL